MAELLIRAGTQDAALITRVLIGPPVLRPNRVVVDAHTPLARPLVVDAAVKAGVPFLVDPQTYFLQDYQHSADAWALLPYGDPAKLVPADLLRGGAADRLAAAVIDHQLACGATMIIAPYVHIEASADGWARVQIALWRATQRHVRAAGLSLPLIALVAVGWRLVDPATWADVLDPLQDELRRLAPAEIALAASKIDQGAHPEERLNHLVATVRRLKGTAPVLAWNQGALGEAAVAAGAAGYETGIAWRDRCDIRSAMTSRRTLDDGPRSARPVYIDGLRRSLPKKSVAALLHDRSVATDLICLDLSCCPDGRDGLLTDQRGHAIGARLRSLATLAAPSQEAWRWNTLAMAARTGIDLADRINIVASRGGITRVDSSALRATLAVADQRRQYVRRSAA